MKQLLAGLDVAVGIEPQKAVVGLVDLPFRIRRDAMVVEHAASHDDEIVVGIVRAGEQIVVQAVDLLKVVIIDHDIGAALQRLAGGDILGGKHAKTVYR